MPATPGFSLKSSKIPPLRLSALSGRVVVWGGLQTHGRSSSVLSFRDSLRDVRSFAEGSKRFVTGGMDAAGVLAICLKRQRKVKT